MKHVLKQSLAKCLLLFLCTHLIFFPAWLSAKPIRKSLVAPSVNSMPVLVPNQAGNGWAVSQDEAAHYTVVNQTGAKVVIQWQSFDIGANAHTHFEQPANGSALNRIYDNNPSQIYGQLSATGKIYLVNQNGVLFGENSRVNLHSLVASSLNIQDNEFINSDSAQERAWHFSADNYMNDSRFQAPGDVINQGALTSEAGGRIFLLGANVDNDGTISAEGGHIILSGGQEFEFIQEETSTGTLNESVVTDYSGEAVNSGTILADVGQTGIYGKIVRHDGVIRSLSTVRKGSSIVLMASDRVTTGIGSLIDSGVKESDEDLKLTVEVPFLGRKLSISKPEDQDGKTWDPILIAHYGDIDYASGDLAMDAGDGGRIYLAPGSGIDVGGSWETKQAQDLVMSATLNSIEMRDEFVQKNGILLGKEVYFRIDQGVGIGNLSDHLSNRALSVYDHSGTGGNISLNAGGGDIIIDSNASINVSGGGIRYQDGIIQTTKFFTDGQVYDISEAPDYLTYEKIINPSEETKQYQEEIQGFTQGADAGKLTLVAKAVAFEGNLEASAVRGNFQINLADPVDELGYKQALGTKIPLSGSLYVHGNLGGLNYRDVDPVVDAIVIKNTTPGIGTGFNPEFSPFPSDRKGQTWLSDDLLANSGLGTVSLGATTSIITEKDTSIGLAAGGSLTLTARRILHQGDIYLPSGNVTFKTNSNKSSNPFLTGSDVVNPDYVSKAELGPERIELVDGSSIVTAGEKINNHAAYYGNTGNYQKFGLVGAGNITLKDQTKDGEGVVLRRGSLLDVSGGYIIAAQKGALSAAGDAGTLEIMGRSIALGGELRGASMLGANGGSVRLHAWKTKVLKSGAPEVAEGYSSETSLPEAYQNQMVINDDLFDKTGFTNIALSAYGDLSVEAGASLAPSQVKQVITLKRDVELADLSDTDMAYVGDSSITLGAGDDSDFVLDDTGGSHTGSGNGDYQEDATLVKIGSGASITVAPGGKIKITGDSADISGVFRAPAGLIAINTKSELNTLPLLIRKNTRFFAQGYTRDTGSRIQDKIIWGLEDGGEIRFDSKGALIIEQGAVADVSGGTPTTLYRTSDNSAPKSYTGAAQPGTISLSFLNGSDESGNSTINGRFLGQKSLAYLRGGTFILENNSLSSKYELPGALMDQIRSGGFESLDLTAKSGLNFSESQTLYMAGQLRIDTPFITAGENARVTLAAPWVKLDNSYLPLDGSAQVKGSILNINGDCIDIKGDIAFNGFDEVGIRARNDIRLSDRYYTLVTGSAWAGEISADSNLTLEAARVYPTTASEFKIKAEDTITVLPSGVVRNDPIYSALGKLTLEAENINHRGYIAAPLGEIFLNADQDTGRVYLDNNSVLTVAGQTGVNYGVIDESNLEWYGYDKATGGFLPNTLIESAPEKKISILGNEVIGREEAVVDINGGGGIFGYAFQGSIQGSMDPLSPSNRYVIIPSGVGNLPGEAVYLEENDLVPEGMYTLLPESYAFMDGAVVIEYQGDLDPTVAVRASAEGYAMAVGFEGDKASGRVSSKAGVYTLRPASDVRAEGQYATAAIDTGSGGKLTVIGTQTNVFNSKISAQAVSESHRGGILTLIGKDVFIGKTSAELGDHFDFNTAFDSDDTLTGLTGKLYLDARKLSEAGLWEFGIGSSLEDLDEAIVSQLSEGQKAKKVFAADTITFEAGSLLSGQRMTLMAENNIKMETGSGLKGTGDSAFISLLSTTGRVIMDQGSSIDSDNALSLDAQGLSRGGEITASNIHLASDRLYLADTDNENTGLDGLVIDQAFWQSMSRMVDGKNVMDTIQLTGREMIGFAGSISMDSGTAIVVDTPVLAGITDGAGSTVSLSSESIVLLNSHEDEDGNGKLGEDTWTGKANIFTASADRIFIGQGNTLMSGFNAVGLNAAGNLTFVGQGGFDTGNADLNISSAKVTGSFRNYTENEETRYEALDFKIDSGAGMISMTKSDGSAAAVDSIGGKLAFTGLKIENSGIVDLSSGIISFETKGRLRLEDGTYIPYDGGDIPEGATYVKDEGVYMKEGSLVSAKGRRIEGTDYDLGTVYYGADNGDIQLAQGSVTDVSADPEGGNGGRVWVNTPNGKFDLQGEINGTSAKGMGGEFAMDVGGLTRDGKALTELASLLGHLNMGGADNRANRIDLRLRTGDVSVSSNLAAHEFRLSVDQGKVDVDAIIDASGTDNGGRIEIYAQKELTLSADTELLAKGLAEGAAGGEIILSNATTESLGSSLFMNIGNAKIDVSGGENGSILLRVARNQTNDDVNITGIDKENFTGADLEIEGVAFHETLNFSNWKSKAGSFMDAMDKLTGTGKKYDGLSFIPGMEYQTPGNLTLSSKLDMTSWRFGTNQVAAALTFRAGGNLSIANDMVDHPSSLTDLLINTPAKSTRINLAAGSTFGSADLFAVQAGAGDLKIEDAQQVYTESGGINFASGGNTTIGKSFIYENDTQDYMTANKMKYNLGSYSGNIRGYTRGDLVLDSGVIQTATGDIRLDIAGDLKQIKKTNPIYKKDYIGSIRTIGQPMSASAQAMNPEKVYEGTTQYHDGGNIDIRVQGDASILSNGKSYIQTLPSEAWYGSSGKKIELTESHWGDWTFYLYDEIDSGLWAPNYDGLTATQGIAAMGGGDVSITTMGSFFGAAGTFGIGDLSISATGDIDGRFLNKDGVVSLSTMGNFGMMEGTTGQVVEAFDSQIKINAQGDIKLGAVVNPTNVGSAYGSKQKWDLQYTQDTSLSMQARVGSVTLTGTPDASLKLDTEESARLRVLPPSLYVRAGTDIKLKSSFYLPPAENGQLELIAGRDITSQSDDFAGVNYGIFMSDMNISEVYGNHDLGPGETGNTSQMTDLANARVHGGSILHAGDSDPVQVIAGNNISHFTLALPKAAVVRAGNDISDIRFIGQNLRAGDITEIYAGNTLYFQTERNQTTSLYGIQVGGPGLTLVQAGNSIDLGTSLGIQSLGSLYNSTLPAGDNPLVVMAGVENALGLDELDLLFNGDSSIQANTSGYADLAGFVPGADGLRQAGTKYTNARSNGDQALADQILADARSVLIDGLTSGRSGSGKISLINSRIFSSGGAGSIFALATGQINVGVSSIKSPPILGEVETSNDEASGIYTTAGGGINLFSGGDININEARVMTFDGGDIVIWSDRGNINAGMGSKVATASAKTYWEKVGDTYELRYEPPAVGSGIRATAPDLARAGDIYAFAPSGTIDAGEAGIAGKNVILAANEVVNAQNIETSGLAVGFTKPSDSSANVGGLSGSSGMADAAMLDEEAAGLDSSQNRLNEEAPEGYSMEPRWVDVEVMGFVEDEEKS